MIRFLKNTLLTYILLLFISFVITYIISININPITSLYLFGYVSGRILSYLMIILYIISIISFLIYKLFKFAKTEKFYFFKHNAIIGLFFFAVILLILLIAILQFGIAQTKLAFP